MKVKTQRRVIEAILMAVSLSMSGALYGQDTVAEGETHAPDSGSLLGTVIYKPDSERRWRYQRHYVARSRTGELAEAVVVLESKGQKAVGKNEEPQTKIMDQINFQFVPESLAIRSGDSVRFTNSEAVFHNVMTNDGDRPFNRSMVMGADYVHQFKSATGLSDPIRISCVYHGAMKAWIFVFNHRYFDVTKEDGQFRLENVPPGKYMLQMKHVAGRLYWQQEIDVTEGDATEVTIEVSPDHLIPEPK